MISSSKLKSVDFYRKIRKDLTEASLSGAGFSIIAALSMMLLFGMIEHYLLVVKTEVMSGKSGWEHKLVEEYEYTAHTSLVHSVNIPVAKFHFELAPMQVLVKETRKSFSHFITNVCAIIGGVSTVAGILDSVLHNTIRLVKKVELSKLFL